MKRIATMALAALTLAAAGCGGDDDGANVRNIGGTTTSSSGTGSGSGTRSGTSSGTGSGTGATTTDSTETDSTTTTG